MTGLSISVNANPCDDGGIGGTGIPLSRGIGGTGIYSNKLTGIGGTGITSKQEGIGGTGIETNSGIGGTGIVGIITGFGSICVNGLEVMYFTDTPVDLDGKKISSEALSVGQVIALKASGKDQFLIANEIHVFNQITGPITAIDISAKYVRVMGQLVIANSVQINNLQVGQWVNVSGLRNENGSVEASRIEVTADHRIVQTVGNLSIRDNQVFIGDTKIDGISKSTINTNVDSRLTGIWNGNSFNVKNVKLGPVSELLQKVEVFHLQGTAAQEISNGKIRLSGQNLTVPADTKILGGNSTSIIGKPIVVHGQMKDGRAIAKSIELRPLKSEMKNLQVHQMNSSKANTSSNLTEKTSDKTIKSNDENKLDHESKKTTKSEINEEFANLERVQFLDKPDNLDKPDKIDRVEIPDKIEKIDRIEIPDKVEKVERRDN